LGNLTLTGFNSELSDKPYSEKQNQIKEKSKFIILNEEFRNHNMWNESAIIARAKRLSQLIIDILVLPDIIRSSLVSENQADKFTLADYNDYSGKKPINLVILSEARNVSSWKDLLSETLNFLYNDWDNEILVSLAREKFKLSSQRIYLSFDSTEMTKPYQIENSTIFFETHLSANNILSFIRTILDKYDIPYSDVVFYINTNYTEEQEFEDENQTLNIGEFYLKNEKIGRIAKNFFKKMLSDEIFSEDEISWFLNKTYSRDRLGIDFPLIVENYENTFDEKGRKRYYSDSIKYKNRDYYICSQWYDYNREKLIQYITNRLNDEERSDLVL
jgi:hypothetical protein